MKILLLITIMSLAGAVAAHDDGHGPMLSDTGKYGGLVAAVVRRTDASKGSEAALVHKAELVRSGDNTVRVYLYNQEMKPLDLSKWDAKGSGSLAVKVKGKWKESTFGLERKDRAFIGKMPKPEGRPYNIDITLKENGTELLSAFDNLD